MIKSWKLFNDEIISVATYDKNSKKIFFERNDILKASRIYDEGGCGDYL
jgi:hypothetical protein